MEEDGEQVDGAWGRMEDVAEWEEEEHLWNEEELAGEKEEKLERARNITEMLTGVRWPIYPGAWRLVSGRARPNLADWSLMMWQLGKARKEERDRKWVLLVGDWAKPTIAMYTRSVS